MTVFTLTRTAGDALFMKNARIYAENILLRVRVPVSAHMRRNKRSIMMKLKTHGKTILSAEVTNISNHGFWLMSNETEYFLSYIDFLWIY